MSRFRFSGYVVSVVVPAALALSLSSCALESSDEDVATQSEALGRCGKKLPYTVDDAFEATPFAIGHRGSGVNLGEDPTRPIENTIPAIRDGFLDGARMVEIDVQLTADGKVVVYHDDFLPDYTCINTLTFTQLKAVAPQIPSLRGALAQTKLFNRWFRDRGTLMVELKPPSPLCDPGDTGDVALSLATVDVIARAGMEEQVILTSFSPTMLATTAQAAPDIDRALDLNAVQLLPPEQVEAITGLPVTEITKANGLGLQWAEVGPIYRLPGYDSIEQFIGMAYYLGCTTTLMDRLVPLQVPSQAGALVEGIHALGMKTVMWTVNDEPEWQFFASIGVDGIVTDDVPLGVSLQAP